MKKVKYPKKLLEPIKENLEGEVIKLKSQAKKLKASDPFFEEGRTTENSLEEDVDEQIGHMDAEVKVNFIRRQIIQFRKALTRMKIGKYGICERCGKMIDTDRLAIRPESTICIKCERADED